jgi:glycosyltransferase involved in cell wall biosynthesis
VKNIFQVVEKISKEMGGLRTSVTSIDDYINSQDNFNSTILTSKKEKEDTYVEFVPQKIDFWCYSTDLKTYLETNISKADIVHTHGVFMYPQYISCKIAENQKIPYLITAHGMLEPYLNKGSIKKKVYSKLFLDNMLKKASAIHAITPFEKNNLFCLTKHKNIVEIPNFISFSEIPVLEIYNPTEEYLLYLGRIHEGKGLDILIQSISKIDNTKIKLKIVGTENEYSEVLKKLSRDLNIDDRIDFMGGVYGHEKYKLYTNAKVMVAPSFSEVIGMVNLEAAACKTPVITTFNTGINPNWNTSGGIMINPNTDELINAINQSVNWSTGERNQRGYTLSDFVRKNYSWEEKGYLWNELYNSLLK